MATVRAPEIDRPGLVWLNVPRPLSLEALRGRLVILDFWTFGCINCLHLIPTLKRVEARFPDEVTVIGVHSPKFEAERDSDAVKAALTRHGVTHAVVHDPARTLWRQYAVRAWPTLVFVGPDSRVLGQSSGEPDPDSLLDAVARVLDRYREAGALRPGAIELLPPTVAAGGLRFPGKIRRIPGAGLYALADSGHNQIVLLDRDGRERDRFGDGGAGLADGPAEGARFDAPQGVVAGPGAVYVADTGNHALRRIDLARREVSTIAGTGGRGLVVRTTGPGRRTALASPWDVELAGDRLYAANAGTHQILALHLRTGALAPLAGSGHEGLVDGPGAEAQFAQPSGLALSSDGGLLYVADSESSAVRVVTLGTAPTVATLVGAGLFDFGHVNGPFAAARLQHPLGIAVTPDGDLLVADSYNGAIRRLDTERREVGDYDSGFVCVDPVCLPLHGPAGVWAEPERVLVADTDGHRVLILETGARRMRTWAS